jgi:hypothetical protein
LFAAGALRSSLRASRTAWSIPRIPTTRGLSCANWSRFTMIRECSGNAAAVAVTDRPCPCDRELVDRAVGSGSASGSFRKGRESPWAFVTQIPNGSFEPSSCGPRYRTRSGSMDQRPTMGASSGRYGRSDAARVCGGLFSEGSLFTAHRIQLQNDLQLLRDLFHNLERLGQFFLGVRCGDDGADACLTMGNGGVANTLREHARLE